MPASPSIDVAVNIFAKPFQTALALLSLLRVSARHIGIIYLQFEPVGSRYDSVLPFEIAYFLRQELGEQRCHVYQPSHWIDLKSADDTRFHDAEYRLGIRYQYAFEHSTAPLLFVMHNDVLVQRDILGALCAARGDAFAIGLLGQCWNCPASNAILMQEVCGCPPCSPVSYQDFRPDTQTLHALYREAHARYNFARPYDQGFEQLFARQPWPLPECRINEWACLVDLEKTRPLTVPFGDGWPLGAFRQCGPVCLDTGVEWFRAMHRHGLHARHFPIGDYLTHWVGTGKVTFGRYAKAEANALRLLQRHFPAYVSWLCQKTQLAPDQLLPVRR